MKVDRNKKEELKDSPSENMSELISELNTSYIDTFDKYKHYVLEDIFIDNLLRIGCPKDVACVGNMEDIYHWLIYTYNIAYRFSTINRKNNRSLYVLIEDINNVVIFSYIKDFTNENDYRSAYYTLNNFAISAICSYIYINNIEYLH